MMKKSICIGLSFIMCLMFMVEPINATSTKNAINSKKQQKQQLENDIDSLNNQISNIENKKQEVNNELNALESQLVDLLTSISICQDEINDKEAQVKQAKAELKEAESAEEEQYADMKKRMKFMYEQGDMAYIQVCLEAKSISEMVNKAEYIEKVYDYDRELLAKYQNTKEAVEQLKVNLEEEEAELLACQYELEEEQHMMEQTIEQKQATVANFEDELKYAQSKVADYKQELKKQTAEIKQLEDKQKKEAEAAAAAKNTSNTNNNSNKNTTAAPTVSGGSATGQAIANYACQFVGNPYVFGGTSLTNGTDCSGFTQAVYAHFGISIPRDSTSQRSVGRAVSYAEAAPGDIVCYAGHVAIYLGNGSIVHASSERTGIKYGTATYRTILSIRRIV